MPVKVKICGITTVDDVKEACRLGVDAIGLVFFKGSERFVTVKTAVDIIAAVDPFVTVTALFVNQPSEDVYFILDQCKVGVLQFHGNETPSFCRQFNRPYIKAVRMQSTDDLLIASDLFSDAMGLLADAYVKGEHGGTGRCFNWDLIPTNFTGRLILSGGLNPDNVFSAILQTRPNAVDVSSGVERIKGIKDSVKMAAFIQGAKNAIL